MTTPTGNTTAEPSATTACGRDCAHWNEHKSCRGYGFCKHPLARTTMTAGGTPVLASFSWSGKKCAIL